MTGYYSSGACSVLNDDVRESVKIMQNKTCFLFFTDCCVSTQIMAVAHHSINTQ